MASARSISSPATLVEVAPPYDHSDITAIAAATVAMYYLGLLAEQRRG